MNSIVFVDSEISPKSLKILDLGAVKPDGSKLHSSSQSEFSEFVIGTDFVCGHNIIAHDLKYIGKLIEYDTGGIIPIDTLCLSPLLFPNRPYHALLKDDKLQSDELNNPLNDAIKASILFYDELNAFNTLDDALKNIFCSLLYGFVQFNGFFVYLGIQPTVVISETIEKFFAGRICKNANLSALISNTPIELAYCLALICANDRYSVTPPWVYKNYPLVENAIKLLRNTPCTGGCEYCNQILDVNARLKDIFGYNEFRKYNGEPLQEKAAAAAVHNRSLLAIFPTGGGKSITFQLPALIAGETVRGLTVIISPLQSLMKDQVDNLERQGIVDAVTINGLLSPIERAEALERVESGMATLLYISPESLRSKTIERLLVARNVVRFVIDEAHCFSAWGQDFRVDYMYIGDFIREIQEKKQLHHNIPVSCFTATAKQKVVSDICDYFKHKLGIDLEIYATNAARSNLRYAVLYKETDEEKYSALRNLIEAKNCPTIVYVSRVKRTVDLAKKLKDDGFTAKPYYGHMESSEKIATQEAFINNDVQIIVATSAFGMGVDKKDVKLVIHYDISDSLENYVQEAGRAGRDQSIQAECFVLFNDNDLDKHFMLLNQTKLSISEIQQVWRAIKDLTKMRDRVSRSPLEIARQAGWDDSVQDIETRVKTAVAALENAGYIKRGKNMPRIFADSILVKNMEEATSRIDASVKFNPTQKEHAKRIIKSLISSRNVSKAGNAEAESRIDYISDMLGIEKSEVIGAINLMREEGLLADSKDLSAYIRRSDNHNKSATILRKYERLEDFIMSIIPENGVTLNLKEINEQAIKAGIKTSTVKDIKTTIYYWTIKGFIHKNVDVSEKKTEIRPKISFDDLKQKYNKRIDIARFIVQYLFEKTTNNTNSEKEEVIVQFSVLELKSAYSEQLTFVATYTASISDIEDALLYLAKIGALSLEGGFLVLYSAIEIQRLVLDNKIQYKLEDYKYLNEFYRQKIQQIHIVGEYANMMVRNYNEALQFVNDYFQIDFKQFIAKYFKGTRAGEINRNITPAKYAQLFDSLSETQRKIITDDTSKYIVVAAGPGSGKTRVLVHKLASLLLLEDVKHEQLLMVTFSRVAATEFKKRLVELIGNAANFVEIKTFHSYCFDLLGKIGSLEDSESVVQKASEMIRNGEVEIGRITKNVVVIDEAQDMDESEYALIEALMDRNDDMRVIAVGDDDQNIYEFRGSDSKYLRSFVTDKGAEKYELLDNYRSKNNIVALANTFASTITDRMKIQPIVPIHSENGTVRLIQHTSRNLEIPIANEVRDTYKDGTACVLTNTNDEALKVMGLLIKNGMRAKLIQSNDGFNLYNLAEIRYFLKHIDKNDKTAVISNEIWNEAKNSLSRVYFESTCLEVCLNMIRDFEQTHSTKYRTDLEEFIKESQYDDFYSNEQGVILVSTIHKSKGREFDNVYMLLNNVAFDTDVQRRKIYVGLTRAKQNLFVHYNKPNFIELVSVGVERFADNTSYPEPEEIIVQLSHKDVFLDFFKDKKGMILSLKSGASMVLSGNGLSVNIKGQIIKLLIFSKFFRDKLEKLKEKGYNPTGAKIRFIVAWKGEEATEESAVILPDIYFNK